MTVYSPIDAFVAWQAFVLAVIVAVVTTGIKTVINLVMKGEAKRKKNKWITQIILPMLPIVFGVIGGIFIPLRPDVVVQYVSEHHVSAWSVFGAWGAVIGVFADYLYQRVKKGIEGFTKSSTSKEE
jgi:hypothetical protein